MIKKLRQQLDTTGQSQLSSLLVGSQVIKSKNDNLILGVSSSRAADVLAHRGTFILKALAAIGEHYKAVEFQIALPELEPVEFEQDTYSGTYHNEYNAVVQPNRHLRVTRYFLDHWQPLLKPLGTCLVNELRKRCYKDKHDAANDRDNFKTTYKSLADALGVTERTIQRTLQRDSEGNFVNNPYLSYFIKDMENILKTDEKGNIRSFGTRFVIYLDEPILPSRQNVASV